MSRIIFKVLSIDFIFGLIFTACSEGDKLHEAVVHGPEPVYGRKLQERLSLFLLSYIHYRLLHENSLSDSMRILKNFVGSSIVKR